MSYQRKIIIVSGFVGAGKTTIVQNLAKYLRQYDVCSKSISAFPNISYYFFKAISILLYGRKITRAYKIIGVHPATLITKRFYNLPKFLAFITILIEVISIHLAFLRITFNHKNSRIIIIDEGPINMVANYLEVLNENAKYLFFALYKLIRCLQQRFDMVFVFLTTDPNILIKRWAARHRPFPTILVDLHHHLRYLKLLMHSRDLFEYTGFKIMSFDTSNSNPKRIVQFIIRALSEDF